MKKVLEKLGIGKMDKVLVHFCWLTGSIAVILFGMIAFVIYIWLKLVGVVA